jgi:mono/diheme cytochrome c family protein
MGVRAVGRSGIVAGIVSSIALAAVVASSPVNAQESTYTVECDGTTCIVDKKTYVGWRTYHAECHVCHAQDAVGSTFAPNLIDRMKEIDKERFMEALTNGYTGQMGVMPAWKDNPNVNKRFEELYFYLMARSDGVLLPGRPKKK